VSIPTHDGRRVAVTDGGVDRGGAAGRNREHGPSFAALPEPTLAYALDADVDEAGPDAAGPDATDRADAAGRPVVAAVNPAFEAAFGAGDVVGDPLADWLVPGPGRLADGTSPTAVAARIADGERVRVDVAVDPPGEIDAAPADSAPGSGTTGTDVDPAGDGDDGGYRRFAVRSVPVVAGSSDTGVGSDDPALEPPTDGPTVDATTEGAPVGGIDGYLLFVDCDGAETGTGTGTGTGTAALADRADRLETVASVVSHDLLNPLDVARIRLDAAQETGEAVHFEKVRAAHERILRISRDVLFLTDPDRTVDARLVDLAEVATAAWETVDTADSRLRLGDVDDEDEDGDGEDDETGGLPRVVADADRLRRALENLFRNAVDHAGEAPTVRVRPCAGGFAVEDDGPGIPPADRERVFEPRETLDGGTGLGLAVVRHVADVHGWDVRARAADAGGARFEFVGVERVEP